MLIETKENTRQSESDNCDIFKLFTPDDKLNIIFEE